MVTNLLLLKDTKQSLIAAMKYKTMTFSKRKNFYNKNKTFNLQVWF